jgi:putative ABC transport system permease protein
MDVIGNIRLSLEVLSSNRVRSFLTMLGVVIGVSAVILLVSIGEGTKEYVSSELAGLGANLLLVNPGKVGTAGGVHPPLVGAVRKMIYEDALAIKRRCPSVAEVCPIVFGTGRIKYQNLSRDIAIVGVTPEFERVRNLYVEVGRFITEQDVGAGRHVVILGQRVRKELFGDSNPLGRRVTISDARYRVEGLMAHKGMSLGFDIDDLIFIPVRAAQELFDNDRLFQIMATAKSSKEIKSASAEIRAVLTRRHANKEDFTIVTQEAMLFTMREILDVLTGVLVGIAAISLVVGGVGIMNVMLVSVRERTREIGIRKAVGARNGDILGQFLVESVTLSLIGGAVGIVVGAGGALLASSLFSYIPTKVSLWSISLAFFFSAAVGIFFGVYPARRASLLDPIEALRCE